ncbi:hypothetical protein J6590_019497 [Homalodisca vitripennis]|nr:hypothetical protein J6590_019497 [Homalodisca vitripennis]
MGQNYLLTFILRTNQVTESLTQGQCHVLKCHLIDTARPLPDISRRQKLMNGARGTYFIKGMGVSET